jgi:hypothetical protein
MSLLRSTALTLPKVKFVPLLTIVFYGTVREYKGAVQEKQSQKVKASISRTYTGVNTPRNNAPKDHDRGARHESNINRHKGDQLVLRSAMVILDNIIDDADSKKDR